MIIDVKTDGYNANSNIISIQIKRHDKQKNWFIWNSESEEKFIDNFIDYFLKEEDKILMGFNILKFQIPLLLIKSINNRNFNAFFSKLNYSNITDIFIILTFNNKGELKPLEYYCNKYGVKFRPAKQTDIVAFLSKKEFSKLERVLDENIGAIYHLSRKVWKENIGKV